MKEEMLKQILINQRNIMIRLSKGAYYEGYFKLNIEDTEKLIEGLK